MLLKKFLIAIAISLYLVVPVFAGDSDRVRSHWQPIRFTRGVTGLVAFGDSDPLPVSDHIVGSIRDGCRECTVSARFTPGDRVAIVSSGIRDPEATAFWGQLSMLDGEGRAVVLLSLLGRENRVQVATDRLVPA